MKTISLAALAALLLILFASPVLANADYSRVKIAAWWIPGEAHIQPDLIVTSDSMTDSLSIIPVTGNMSLAKNSTYLGNNSTFMFYELPFIRNNTAIEIPVLQVPFVQREGLV